MRFLTYLATALAVFCGTATAAPVTYNFTVLLSQATVGGVGVGTTLSGSLTYDLSQSTNIGGSTNRGYSFDPGAATFSFAAHNGFSRSGQMSIQVANSNADVFEASVVNSVEQYYFTLRDTSSLAWTTTLLDQIPDSTLTDLSHFSQTAPPINNQRNFLYQDFTPGTGGTLFGEIQTFTAASAAIPAPGAAALFGVAALATLGIRRIR